MIELATKTDIQTVTLKETEYVVVTKKEYIELLEKIEDLEDVIHIKNAKLDPDNQRGFTIDEVAKECGIDMDEIRNKHKNK